MAMRRIQKVGPHGRPSTYQPRLTKFIAQELVELNNNPVPNISAGPVGDDLLRWQGQLIGPVSIMLLKSAIWLSMPYRRLQFHHRRIHHMPRVYSRLTLSFPPTTPSKPQRLVTYVPFFVPVSKQPHKTGQVLNKNIPPKHRRRRIHLCRHFENRGVYCLVDTEEVRNLD